MNTAIQISKLKEAAKFVRNTLPNANPLCAIVLGSGWSEAIGDFEIVQEIDFSEIPNLGKTGVIGHVGKLILAKHGDKEILIFQGRRHAYEGDGWTPVIMPAFIAKQMGCEYFLITNASGGIGHHCPPGALVAIEDHINFLGENPLQGKHRKELGERFPDMSEIYRKELRKILQKAGAETEGIYIAASGPSFETPAEIRAFATMGADLVGMSTVPEAIVGNAMGLKIAALSCVCNWAAGISETPLSGEDVIETAKKTMPKMRSVISKFVELLPNENK